MDRFALVAVASMCLGCSNRDYVVVAIDDGPTLMQTCSRPAPIVEAFWVANENDIRIAERHLHQIRDMHVGLEPDSYVRQYIGVIVRGQRFLYLNAVRAGVARYPGAYTDIREPIIICDGGDVSWGAIFDPETSKFSDLAVNIVGG